MAWRRTWARTWLLLAACLAALPAFAQDIAALPGAFVDDQERPFALPSLRGRPTLITMAYGACRRVCSTSLRMMEQLQALADARGLELNFVVVGLDPREDRPADWAAYRADRKLGRPNWHFLSTTDAGVRTMAQRLRVRYWRYGDHLMHDLRIVLLSEGAVPLRSVESFDADLLSLLP